MTLPDTYEAIRPAIVAFTSGVVGRSPAVPQVIGTGFVVDSRGVVATNRHVVESLAELPRHPRTGKTTAAAWLFLGVQTSAASYTKEEVMNSEIVSGPKDYPAPRRRVADQGPASHVHLLARVFPPPGSDYLPTVPTALRGFRCSGEHSDGSNNEPVRPLGADFLDVVFHQQF